ncbi:unnamed protein product [Cylindrotheca closterium]|uniref:SWIM-type domain-containing protein n=1 Tax=Cylindrotheca closterium TaxID=2856 RepID=A0AAD2G7D4_9STRA|nr:unnamed protein product [Cylindrotheca closterium]
MTTKTAEKRLKRIRRTCPAKVQERMSRATRENMYLTERPSVDYESLKCEFTLLGSTGNVYDITFGRLPQCTCPDYRKGNTTCKHILFVTTQIMGISPSDHMSYQMAYIGDELEEMYDKMEDKGNGKAFMAKKAVRKEYNTMNNDSLESKMAKMRLSCSSRTPNDSDYANLGKLQGQRSERDTSTYNAYHWEKYPYRRYN